MGLLRSQERNVRTHSNRREIPNNLDSGLVASLQHTLLQQCSGGSKGGGITVGTVDGNEVQYRGSGSKLQGAMADVADLGSQGVVHTPHPQQQNFHPNIPVTSSSMTTSPITHLPSAEFTGIMGGGRSLINPSSIPSSLSSSPIKTCTGNAFGAEYKSDSYVVARGKRVTVESCRKAGSPSAALPAGSLRCNSKQQVLLDSPNSVRSPSNPLCAVTTNASIVSVSSQVAPSPSPCGGGGTATIVVSEDACEANTKLTMVKYVVGGNSDLGLGCESGNIVSMGRGGCCLSEKSSDSGVSSSSVSSANPKENSSRKEGKIVVKSIAGQSVVESPTRDFISYSSCISNTHRSSPTKNSNKGIVLQGSDKSSYQ